MARQAQQGFSIRNTHLHKLNTAGFHSDLYLKVYRHTDTDMQTGTLFPDMGLKLRLLANCPFCLLVTAHLIGRNGADDTANLCVVLRLEVDGLALVVPVSIKQTNGVSNKTADR